MTDLTSIPLGIYEKAIPLALPWKEKFRLAKEAGFDMIELSVDGRSARLQRLSWDRQTILELRTLAEQVCMPFKTMALSANRFAPLGDPERYQDGMDIVRRAVLLASQLNIPIIQLAPYDVFQQPSTTQTRNRFVSSLLELLDYAAAHHITLAMEVLEDVPHFSRVAECARFIKKINHPQLRLYADTGNVAYNGFDAAEDLAQDQGTIIACHLKDAVLHNEHNVPYGSGLVDFSACFRHFKNTDFQGTFTAEVWCEEDITFIPQLVKIQQFLRTKIMEEMNR